jgi:hypothetical protein
VVVTEQLEHDRALDHPELQIARGAFLLGHLRFLLVIGGPEGRAGEGATIARTDIVAYAPKLNLRCQAPGCFRTAGATYMVP